MKYQDQTYGPSNPQHMRHSWSLPLPEYIWNRTNNSFKWIQCTVPRSNVIKTCAMTWLWFGRRVLQTSFLPQWNAGCKASVAVRVETMAGKPAGSCWLSDQFTIPKNVNSNQLDVFFVLLRGIWRGCGSILCTPANSSTILAIYWMFSGGYQGRDPQPHSCDTESVRYPHIGAALKQEKGQPTPLERCWKPNWCHLPMTTNYWRLPPFLHKTSKQHHTWQSWCTDFYGDMHTFLLALWETYLKVGS